MYREVLDAQNKLKLENAKKISPETIYAKAQAAHSYNIAESASEWTSTYPPERKKDLCNIMNAAVPLANYLHIDPNDAPAALVLLHRGGMSEAPVLACLVADARSHDFWQMAYWSLHPGPFDPTGQYVDLEQYKKKWQPELLKGHPFEEIDVAFRRALHRLFRHSINHQDQMVTGPKAATLAKKCIAPSEPQRLQKGIDRLLASTKIDLSLTKDAQLFKKLQAWGTPGEPELVVVQGEEGSASISTMFISPKEAYTPDEKDLDELFKFVDDTSETVFIDFQGSRTVGENAMRAIAVIMEKNPLELIAMDDQRPWSEHEQGPPGRSYSSGG